MKGLLTIFENENDNTKLSFDVEEIIHKQVRIMEELISMFFEESVKLYECPNDVELKVATKTIKKLISKKEKELEKQFSVIIEPLLNKKPIIDIFVNLSFNKEFCIELEVYLTKINHNIF